MEGIHIGEVGVWKFHGSELSERDVGEIHARMRARVYACACMVDEMELHEKRQSYNCFVYEF